MSERCTICGQMSATIQADLFGGPKQCIDCLTNARTAMMLKVLPDEVDLAWEKLSKFEQSFLHSVRQQFARKGALSEKQFQVLENIYEKHN